MTTMTNEAVRELIDRSELADLVHRLGVDLDEHRFDDMRSLLAADATVRTPGGLAEGRDAVVDQASRNHRPDQPSQHVITDLLIDLDGDRAHARANLIVAFGPVPGTADPAKPFELPVRYTAGQVYDFTFVRTPEGWRFATIETTPRWTSGTPIRPAPAG